MIRSNGIEATTLPLFRYMGGKRRLAKHILPLFPKHTTYVEPFCGGAALFFMKEPSKCEVINDINGEIINLYRVVKNHLEELIKQFKWQLVSRQHYKEQAKLTTEHMTDIQRAARFLYLQKQGFGGTGRNFGVSKGRIPGFNLLRIEEELSQAHLRLCQTYIEHLDWQECIKRYDGAETLFYLDPPYWQTAGYQVDFGFEECEAMKELMANMQGKAILSIKDHPDIRDLFKCFQMQSVGIKYSVSVKEAKKSCELILRISSIDLTCRIGITILQVSIRSIGMDELNVNFRAINMINQDDRIRRFYRTFSRVDWAIKQIKEDGINLDLFKFKTTMDGLIIISDDSKTVEIKSSIA